MISWLLCMLFRSVYLCEYLESSKSEHTMRKFVFRYRNYVVDFFSQLHSILLKYTPEVDNMPLASYISKSCHRNYRWFHDFYVCSLGAHISVNTWNHRNPSTPLKSSCFATEIMSWMFSLISTPSSSHTRVKFSMQISNFKQLYLFTEALSAKSEHNSDSLKRST